MHAVDAAGVHPLLLAIGSERYSPMEGDQRRPAELLTLANALLGTGQLSLAKYLLIVAGEDDPDLDVRAIGGFMRHLLSRVDWSRDLHFQTRTTIDTLDYSSPALNEGSKVVIAAAGKPRRPLPVGFDARIPVPENLGFTNPRVVLPGIVVLDGPPCTHEVATPDLAMSAFCERYNRSDSINSFPLIVIVDNGKDATASLEDFLWTTFTRSNPAADIYGIESFIEQKHWGCHGSLVIDARAKPHHAPALEVDPEVSKRVDRLAAKGGSLHGII